MKKSGDEKKTNKLLVWINKICWRKNNAL